MWESMRVCARFRVCICPRDRATVYTVVRAAKRTSINFVHELDSNECVPFVCRAIARSVRKHYVRNIWQSWYSNMTRCRRVYACVCCVVWRCGCDWMRFFFASASSSSSLLGFVLSSFYHLSNVTTIFRSNARVSWSRQMGGSIVHTKLQQPLHHRSYLISIRITFVYDDGKYLLSFHFW